MGKPEFQDFNDLNSTPPDGQSTAAVSSAGTPLASSITNGQKLKLTFGAGGGTSLDNVYTNGGESGVQSDDD